MMMNSIHVVKLPHNYINISNYTNTNTNSNTITSCGGNLFLSNPPNKMAMVHNNNNSAVFPSLLCSKNHNFNCEINVDNVFNTTVDGSDNEDGFTVDFDFSDLYISAVGRAMKLTRGPINPNDIVVPDYIPIRVNTYGVGSKFKLALGIESGMDMDEIIGNDLVAMNFNHIVSLGAQPTMFLTSKACPRKLREAMNDASLWCASRCGLSVSFSDIEKMKSSQITSSIGYGSIEGSIIDGMNIEIGDVLIGLPSNGVHSHGFSLVKRVIEQSGSSLKDNLPGTNDTLGESLMRPTAIYVKEVLDIISKSKGGVKCIAYIASGGFTKRVPRFCRSGFGAVIFSDSWPVPPIFKWIQEVGRIEDDEMRRTFNMGIGMVLVIDKENASIILQESYCKNVYCIGEIVSGGGVTYR